MSWDREEKTSSLPPSSNIDSHVECAGSHKSSERNMESVNPRKESASTIDATPTYKEPVTTTVIDDWVPALAPNGSTYWYSRSTRQTTWNDPLSGKNLQCQNGSSTIPAITAALAPNQASEHVPDKLQKLSTSLSGSSVVDTLPPSASRSRDASTAALSGNASVNPIQAFSVATGFMDTALTPSSNAPVSAGVSGDTVTSTLKKQSTSGWCMIQGENGRVYYHDRVSNRTQWERPKEFADVNGSAMATQEKGPVEHSTFTLERTAQSDGLFTHAISQSPLQETTVSTGSAKLDVDNLASFSGSHSTRSSLPEGWAQHQTPEGRPYYYHALTRETRWDPPLPSFQDPKPTTTSAKSLQNSTSAPTLPTKRKAPDHLTDPHLKSTDQWFRHVTPEGRKYFYNARTQVTAWSLPPGISAVSSPIAAIEGDDKQEDKAESPPHKRAHVGFERQPSKRKVGPARRPLDADGNPMTDRVAETYFLKRAQIFQGSEGNDATVAKNTVKNQLPISTTDVCFLERTRAFYSMLEEASVTTATSWLDVMARCAGDPRYMGLQKYGFRKDAWHKFRAKRERSARRHEIVNSRERALQVVRCLEEYVTNVDDRILTLQRCPPDVVRDVEADPRFRAVFDQIRAPIVRAFFAMRARRAAVHRAQKRKEALERMAEALEERFDPLLKNAVSNDLGVDGDKDRTADKGAISKDPERSEHGPPESTKTMVMNFTVENNEGIVQHNDGYGISRKETPPIFTEKTSHREIERFLQGFDGYEDVSSDDISDLIRRWRRRMNVLIEEKNAREREIRKTKLRENRAMFRTGVLNLILQGKVPFTARWKEAIDVVSNETFAKSEAELGSRPADLFDDGMRMFDERVQRHRDEFKKLVRESEIEVNNQISLETLSTFPPLKKFLDGVEKVIAQALLVDRQRKEMKRRMKEREKLVAEFRRVVISSELPAEVTFEDAVGQWTRLPVYQQLEAAGAQDAMRRVFIEYTNFRRSKDEHDRRLKRKLEMDGVDETDIEARLTGLHHVAGLPSIHGTVVSPGGHGISGLNMVMGAGTALVSRDHAKRQRLGDMEMVDSRPYPQTAARDDDTGWAAVVSEKQSLTDEQKAAERERHKREILQALESDKVITHSQV